MSLPGGHGEDELQLDHAHPFRGIVVCCTSIPPNQRIELEAKVHQLGGVHKHDLTGEVTHLVVGQYDTPKYRHVAKERPDVKAMDARWVDVVSRLWMDDADIDLPALEKEWQLRPLETNGPEPGGQERGRLICCITGFHDPDERRRIIDKITESGGAYTADLDRKTVSHLIVCAPEGKKYKAAVKWGIHTVTLDWLDQTLERGMILHEQFFDPRLPAEEQGQGAWVRPEERKASLGKRSRSATEQGQRKLRKTASMKLNSQRETLWGDILGHRGGSGEPNAQGVSGADAGAGAGASAGTSDGRRRDQVEVADSAADLAAKHPGPGPVSAPVAVDAGIFGSCCFAVMGFETWKSKVLADTITSLGGAVCDSIEELATRSDAHGYQRFLVVPQSSQPDTHPQIPQQYSYLIEVVTEFFIEKCLHNKTLRDPNEQVLGRPFPRFPVEGFDDLALCTAGFTGIDLLHIEKCITQLGAKYASRLNEATSVLICKSLEATRREKLKFAMENKIPIVSVDWLWDCVSTGFNVPLRRFLFPPLRQDPDLNPKPRPDAERKPVMQRTRSEPVQAKPESRSHAAISLRDETAFADDNSRPRTTAASRESGKEGQSTQFETAKTRQSADGFGSGTVPAPVSDAVANVRNNPTPSPQKVTVTSAPSATHVVTDGDGFATEHNAGDPMQGDDPQAGDHESELEKRRRKEEGDAGGNDDHDAASTEKQLRAARRRKQDEQTAAERAAIAAKVTSLFQARTTGLSAAHGPGTTDDSPRDEEATVAAGIVDAGGSTRSVTPVATTAAPAATTKPTRRRKGIFGRATSNVSAASSGSHDSSAAHRGNVTASAAFDGQVKDEGFLRTRSDGALLGLGQIGRNGNNQTDDGDEAEMQPSTQIGYGDPEAAQAKAELLRRMLGEEGAVPSAEAARPRRVVRRRAL